MHVALPNAEQSYVTWLTTTIVVISSPVNKTDLDVTMRPFNHVPSVPTGRGYSDRRKSHVISQKTLFVILNTAEVVHLVTGTTIWMETAKPTGNVTETDYPSLDAAQKDTFMMIEAKTAQ